MRGKASKLFVAILLASAGPVQAEPVPPAKHAHTKGDPLEGFNRTMFRLFQGLDKAVIKPLSRAFGVGKIIPRPVQLGIRHFFHNLREPVTFLNDMLQLKPGKAVRTFARFTVNSTIGVGGLVDVAKVSGLPYRVNGLGNTLARYGVGPGPYIFLPILGPSDLRDFLGGQADGLVLPLAVGKPFNRFYWQAGQAVLTGLDQRSDSGADLDRLLDGAVDPYATLRSVYQQNRAAEVAEILGKKADGGGFDDQLIDPEAVPPSGPESAPMAVEPTLDATPETPKEIGAAKSNETCGRSAMAERQGVGAQLELAFPAA